VVVGVVVVVVTGLVVGVVGPVVVGVVVVVVGAGGVVVVVVVVGRVGVVGDVSVGRSKMWNVELAAEPNCSVTTKSKFPSGLNESGMTVMPLSLRPVFELHECPGIKLLLPGGEVRPGELSLTGSLTEPSFTQLRFDTCVMGPCGIDAKAGITTHLLAETAVKRAAANASQRVVVVADSSKFGRVAFGHVCDLDDIDIVVTDAEADQQLVDELRTAGVDVRCV
jgi:hypothetical protein